MEPGKKYLIRTQSVHPEKLCRTPENKHFLRKKFIQYVTPIAKIHSIDISDYDLVAVIELNSIDELLHYKSLIPKSLKAASKNTSKIVSQQFKSLFSAYSQSYNKAYRRSGRLIKGNFERFMLDEHETSIFPN